MVPNGCSAVWRRMRMVLGARSSRSSIASRTASWLPTLDAPLEDPPDVCFGVQSFRRRLTVLITTVLPVRGRSAHRFGGAAAGLIRKAKGWRYGTQASARSCRVPLSPPGQALKAPIFSASPPPASLAARDFDHLFGAARIWRACLPVQGVSVPCPRPMRSRPHSCSVGYRACAGGGGSDRRTGLRKGGERGERQHGAEANPGDSAHHLSSSKPFRWLWRAKSFSAGSNWNRNLVHLSCLAQARLYQDTLEAVRIPTFRDLRAPDHSFDAKTETVYGWAPVG
jgi:hypothetical protein